MPSFYEKCVTARITILLFSIINPPIPQKTTLNSFKEKINQQYQQNLLWISLFLGALPIVSR